MMPKCKSLHIMRTDDLCHQSVRRALGSERVWVTPVTCERRSRSPAARVTGGKTYFPSTSLAMVANCMFEVPS
jgi:hypothetical protein